MDGIEASQRVLFHHIARELYKLLGNFYLHIINPVPFKRQDKIFIIYSCKSAFSLSPLNAALLSVYATTEVAAAMELSISSIM